MKYRKNDFITVTSDFYSGYNGYGESVTASNLFVGKVVVWEECSSRTPERIILECVSARDSGDIGKEFDITGAQPSNNYSHFTYATQLYMYRYEGYTGISNSCSDRYHGCLCIMAHEPSYFNDNMCGMRTRTDNGSLVDFMAHAAELEFVQDLRLSGTEITTGTGDDTRTLHVGDTVADNAGFIGKVIMITDDHFASTVLRHTRPSDYCDVRGGRVAVNYFRPLSDIPRYVVAQLGSPVNYNLDGMYIAIRDPKDLHQVTEEYVPDVQEGDMLVSSYHSDVAELSPLNPTHRNMFHVLKVLSPRTALVRIVLSRYTRPYYHFGGEYEYDNTTAVVFLRGMGVALRAGAEHNRIYCQDCGRELSGLYVDAEDDATPYEFPVGSCLDYVTSHSLLPNRRVTLDEDEKDDEWFIVDEDSYIICKRCFDSDYCICHDCETVIHNDDSHYVEEIGDNVCDSCVNDHWYWCEHCEEYTSSNSEVHISDSQTEYWCDHCISNDASYCDNCDIYYSNDCDGCPSCGDCDDDDDDDYDHPYVNHSRFSADKGDCPVATKDTTHWESPVTGKMTYSYKPDPIFHHMPDEVLDRAKDFTFGVEDETDKGEGYDFAASLHDIGTVYGKYDGSLGSEGVEVVTHPCTLRFHIESDLWDRVTAKALKHDMRSHDTDTCGLHVHIGRAPFNCAMSDHQEYEAKLTAAFIRFQSEWEKIARRTNSRWSKFDSARFSSESSLDEFKRYLEYSHDDRYRAVNVSNYNTVEIRIFKGTLKVSTIKATLWLVDAVSRFVRDGGDVLGCTFAQLIDYDNAPDFVKEYLEVRKVSIATDAADSSDNNNN